MPYTFSIINSPSEKKGWVKTNFFDAGQINIGTSHDKMGTSIPSLFARLNLFQGAFKACGTDYNKMVAHSVDTVLISECLDLIEFLAQHGQDPKLKVKRWNAQEQIQNLKKNRKVNHPLLKFAAVLESEIAQHPELNDIFIFYWKDSTPKSIQPQEFLIGGTSPYTLAFTSPNWARIMKKNGFSFQRFNGQCMFSPDNVESLFDRDPQFKNMLYGLYQAYGTELQNDSKDLYNYISTMWNNEPYHDANIVAMGANKPAFHAKYPNVLDTTGAQVHSALLPICMISLIPKGNNGNPGDSIASDYEIVPTSDRWRTYISRNNNQVTIPIPLVLNDNGITGAKYIGSSVWNDSCVINEAEIRNQEMHERVAPGGMGTKYPFLIWSDFLEDKILKLPYNQNREKFVTAFAGASRYLLPLKREFFKYFNIDDIDKPAFKGSRDNLVVVKADGNDVVVTINVPIREPNHNKIVLSRRYSNNDIVNADILLAFFPFYRHVNDVMNRYSVMCCGEATLSFVNVENLTNKVNAPSVPRTRAMQGVVHQTEYYSIDQQHFDFVEVSYKGQTALVIPNMTIVGEVQPAAVRYTFAVDFGTSNTYIAHRTTANPNAAPVSFEIGDTDRQTIFLNEKGNYGNMSVNLGYWKREFVPETIGGNGDISYPARTATCETTTFETSQPNLFGNISIGFNMLNEEVNTVCKYTTGLKWLLEQHPGNKSHTSRVENYFLQTLWMLKNESFLNGGGDDFEVRLTFPEAMIDATKTELKELWRKAKSELHLNNCKFDQDYSEAIAPFNCLANQIGASSFLNIDIGGGTNDIFLVVRRDNQPHAYYASSKFAGDDLWGDGIQVSDVNDLKNGFVDFVDAQIQEERGSYSPSILRPLDALKGGIASSSADIMSYFFKNDSEFNTSSKIRGNKYLFSIVIVHYAAILYNVARLINKVGCDIPEKMSFTGMGSKYISLISGTPTVIVGLTKLLLQKYTGKTAPDNFRIIPYDGDIKEITAKGALTDITNTQMAINNIDKIFDYGFDSERDIFYQDVRRDNTIKTSVLETYNSFIDTFKDKTITNFLFTNLTVTIPPELLKLLKDNAVSSFDSVLLDVSQQFDTDKVAETMFFWPLKTALITASQSIPQTQAPQAQTRK